MQNNQKLVIEMEVTNAMATFMQKLTSFLKLFRLMSAEEIYFEHRNIIGPKERHYPDVVVLPHYCSGCGDINSY